MPLDPRAEKPLDDGPMPTHFPPANDPAPETPPASEFAKMVVVWSGLVLFTSIMAALSEAEGLALLSCTASLPLGLLALIAFMRNGPKRRVSPLTLLGFLTPPISFFLALSHVSLGGPKGRLLRIRGKARVAGTRERADWCGPVPEIDVLSPELRQVARERWTLTAQVEHASVPAFSVLATRLVAVGAPASLVERCHRAALDELEHARLTFALASAYAGSPVGPGPLPELVEAPPPARSIDATLARLASTSVLDGCLGEGVAARLAEEGARHATITENRRVLGILARDEARHAELAWDVAIFALESGRPGVREALVSARAALGDPPEATPLPDGVDPSLLRAHGLPDLATTERIRDEVVHALAVRLDDLLAGPVRQAA